VDQKEAEASLKAYEAELETESARFRAAERRVNSLRQVVTGLRFYIREMAGKPVAEANTLEIRSADGDVILRASTPSTRRSSKQPKDAIAALIQEEPRRWSVPEFLAEMQKRGWLDPELKDPKAAIRTAAVRMARKREMSWDNNGGFMPLGVATVEKGTKRVM